MTILSDNALKVAESRYFMEDEDWEKCCDRVASTVAQAERNDFKKYKDEFFEMIYAMDFLPGGRIFRNAGRLRGSLLNCFLLPIGDSIKEIGQCKMNSLILWSDGGGIGYNLSSLRPKGAPIQGIGGESSGLVSFMKTLDYDASVIQIGGGRRAAALGGCNITHPDIEEFLDLKLKDGELSHFNLSVNITNDFIEAVRDDLDWELKFAQKTYKKVKARYLWDKILTNMIKCGEPGLLNFSNVMKNNSYYFSQILGCNPCAEAILPAYGACDLGSVVLPKFITGTLYTNWIKLDKTLRLAVRFLDCVLDVNKYILDEIKTVSKNERRIGIGFMGLSEYFFMKKIRYGSEKSLIETEKLMRFIRDTVYDESVNLAIEKGAFPAFEPTAYCKASFIRKLPARLRMRIRENGIRNVSLIALAPSGTISLLADVTSGIEPLASKAYIRKDRVGDRTYIHPLYKEMISKNEDTPEWFVDSSDLLPEHHFEIQAMCQKYTCGGVSKTILLPKMTSKKELDKLLLEYLPDLKGCTVYRDGSKEGQPINYLTKEEAKKYIQDSTTELSENDVECKIGGCDI